MNENIEKRMLEVKDSTACVVQWQDALQGIPEQLVQSASLKSQYNKDHPFQVGCNSN